MNRLSGMSEKRAKAHPKTASAPCFDRLLFLFILALSCFGTIMVFSASTAYAAIRFDDAYYFIKRQSVWLMLGVGVMLLFSHISAERLKRWIFPLYGAVILLLLLVPFLGAEAGGAKRWIAIGPLSFQPSELAKTVLILLLSYYFTCSRFSKKAREKGNTGILYGILVPLALFLSFAVPVILEKHLSCIIILGTITVCMIFLTGGNGKFLSAMCLGGGGAVTAFALAVEYTRRRITIWLNPELYPKDGGWQTLQGLMAIGSGGFFGLGLGKSRLKHLYVSEPQNDFIFTIACEELGFLGAAAILTLFTLFTLRGVRVAMRNSDPFSS
ncbi:MAG: FtsW/RodA/SpoVE family cell cycle protein, partial [Clostridia bacterium]|nr:FtsW/RodA/SpoVE family cell cycle protein [Clostridia bacterium]